MPMQYGRKWNAKTPRNDINRIVGRLHVGTSHEEVTAAIRERVANARLANPALWSDAIARECEEFAALVHDANRELYRRVTQGG